MASPERTKPAKQIAAALLLCIAMVLPVWFLLPGGKPAPPDEFNTASVPMGQGAGVFDHNSLFAPLKERSDVVPWSLLTRVSTKVENNRVVTVYPPAILSLDGKPQRIQGYMMPLNSGEQHTHFLLSSVPLTCPFCTPGGPESMVEVTARAPVTYTMDVLVVEGDFAVLASDPSGLYYRLANAVSVK